MIARNHETSGFAVACLWATLSGVPAPGALVLGLLGAWAGDWPDIDHAGATATKSLRWLPYWLVFPRDKHGDYRHRKDGRIVWEVRWFPSWPVHRFFCWLSAAIYDRCATELDRKDTTQGWGPAFRVHRGFTHSIWCAGLTGLAWWAVLAPVQALEAFAPLFGAQPVAALAGQAVAIGMLTHIGGDGCTDFGISPVAPVWKVNGRRYPRMGLPEPVRFKVNKWVETAFITPVCAALALYAVAGAFFGPERVLYALWGLIEGLWHVIA